MVVQRLEKIDTPTNQPTNHVSFKHSSICDAFDRAPLAETLVHMLVPPKDSNSNAALPMCKKMQKGNNADG